MTLVLQGDGLLLRAPQPADAQAMVTAIRESQPDIGRFLVWATATYNLADADQWCRAGDGAEQGHQALHVFDATSGQLLGGVGLHAQDLRNGKVELGYWTRSQARGRGVAVRACHLLVGCAFNAMGFTRIELLIAVDNVASQRVADKLGARREGVLRDRLRLQHGLVDAYVYALLKRDHHP